MRVRHLTAGELLARLEVAHDVLLTAAVTAGVAGRLAPGLLTETESAELGQAIDAVQAIARRIEQELSGGEHHAG